MRNLSPLSRRKSIALALAGVASAFLKPIPAHPANSVKVLLVHGRAQGGRDPEEIRNEWLVALQKGAELANSSLPKDLDIRLPFYGDELDDLVEATNSPTLSNIRSKGGDRQEDFLQFQASIAADLQATIGITEQQVKMEYGDNPREKGPLNWEWVQAILKAIDKNSAGLSSLAIETFTRDVFLYLTNNIVRRRINRIVEEELDDGPTIIIAHSLGSVVAYNILQNATRAHNVPLFLTVGSPLGIKTIRQHLAPIGFPPQVNLWANYFDHRDVVALNPLSGAHFPVSKPIKNISDVNNNTNNRHGISGYLSDPRLVREIVNNLAI